MNSLKAEDQTNHFEKSKKHPEKKKKKKPQRGLTYN